MGRGLRVRFPPYSLFPNWQIPTNGQKINFFIFFLTIFLRKKIDFFAAGAPPPPPFCLWVRVSSGKGGPVFSRLYRLVNYLVNYQFTIIHKLLNPLPSKIFSVFLINNNSQNLEFYTRFQCYHHIIQYIFTHFKYMK